MIKKIMIASLIGLFVFALMAQPAKAQFGKVIPIYDKISWKIYESEHFQIYYYFPNKNDWAQEKEYITDMVRWTETAYAQIVKEINLNQVPDESKARTKKTKKEKPYKPFYDSKKKKHYKPRIFFFWSRFHADHHPLFGPLGAIAYAEFTQMRVVCVSKESPDKDIQETVTHEVCHLFQFDLWGFARKPHSELLRSFVRNRLGFLLEGWSQHVSGSHRTNPAAQLIIRYFVLDKIIRYVNIKDWIRYHEDPIICYVLAGYLYDYIKETYGADTFSIFVKEFRKAKPTAEGFEKNVNQVLKTDLAELDRGFRKYMEDQYKHFPIEKKEAFEYGRDILLERRFFSKKTVKLPRDPNTGVQDETTIPDLPKKKIEAAYEPVTSPSSNLIAAFVFENRADDNTKVALLNRDGAVVKRLTGGHSLYKYGLRPIIDLDGPGRALSFSPNGDYVLYFAQTAGRNPVLILINVVTKTKKVKNYSGKEVEQVKIKSKVEKVEIVLDDPESPEMSKDGKTVIFSAIKNGQRDIFSLNPETKEIKNLTNDEQFDYGPSFAPDEKTIVYVVDISGYKKLFALNLETLEKTQLTFGESNETRPIYSSDGKTIWFISDQDKDKTKNIYSLDFENDRVSQWTDVINSVQSAMPTNNNKIIFSAVGYRDSQHMFGYNLYEMELNNSISVASADNLLKTTTISSGTLNYNFNLDIAPDKIKKYNPWKNIYLDSAMFYGGTSNLYGWYGFGYAYLTEFSNTKHIQAKIWTVGDWYKYNTLSFFDISQRLEWGIQIASENHYFYPWFVSWGYNPYGKPAMDEMLYYLRFKRTQLTAVAQYPLDLCHRIEFSLSGTNIKYTSYIDWQSGVDWLKQEIENPVNYFSWYFSYGGSLEDYLKYLAELKEYYGLRADFLKKYINDGRFATFHISFVRDTALFKRFGPFTNDMYRIDFSWSTGGHNMMLSGEARKYLRLGSEWSFAARGYAGAQFVGKRGTINPWIIGDLGELRGYEWMQFMGNRILLTNFELRFPLTKNFNLLGMYLGDIRAALFMDLAKIWFDDKRFNVLNYDEINSGLVKGSAGIDLSMPFTLWIFGSELHLAISKRMTEVKFLPKFEDKWQVKLYFGHSF